MNLMKLQVLAVLAAVCCLGGADTPPKGTKDAKDPQSSYEPRSKPGAGQKFLEKFVGDWDVVKTFFPMNGKPIVSKGRSG